MPTQISVCPSCGAHFNGPYCAQCGERQLQPDAHRLRPYLAEWFETFFAVDNKLLRTVRVLATAPGTLTQYFVQGRRVGYVRPLQLFLLANLVYFIAQPYTGFNTFNTTLAIQERAVRHSDWARAQVQAKLQRENRTHEEFEKVYNSYSNNLAKSLIILFVPVFALVFYLLHSWYGASFLQYMTLSLHFLAFLLMIYLVLYPPLFYGLLMALRWVLAAMGFGSSLPIEPEQLSSLMTGTLLTLYLGSSFHRVCAQARWLAYAKAALFCFVLLFPLIDAYRLLLFVLTLYQV